MSRTSPTLQCHILDTGYCLAWEHHILQVAGLFDFPAAEFIASRPAYEDIAFRRGLHALSRAFIPDLLPGDFSARARFLTSFEGPSLPALGPTNDLFGDGSLLLLRLPGHACGQLGLLAHTERGRILFTADGCWQRRSIRECRPPSRLTHLFIDDSRAARSTMCRLHDFARAWPDVVIVPSHCPEAFAQEVEAYHESS